MSGLPPFAWDLALAAAASRTAPNEGGTDAARTSPQADGATDASDGATAPREGDA